MNSFKKIRIIVYCVKSLRSRFCCKTHRALVCNSKTWDSITYPSVSNWLNISDDFRRVRRFSNAAHAENVRNGGPLVEYEKRIVAGKLANGDNYQVRAIQELQRLYEDLVKNADACRLESHVKLKTSASFKNSPFWSYLMRQTASSPVKGLYIYGGVGTGKTMLMDLFFDQLPCNWRKQRIHFHDFMLNVHSAMQKHRNSTDPLEAVSSEICEKTTLLCLDEFMVPDIAIAFILNRLFRHLFSKGAILVSTSNCAPENLYHGGLQQDLFLPFVATLKERCLIHEIGSSVDYRKLSSAGESLYYHGKDSSILLKQKFQLLVGEHRVFQQEVEVVMGRKLQVLASGNGCSYFTFEELCNKPLGAADYSALFKKFHALALEGVPIFGQHNRPSAYRFVTLVDVMYDCQAIFLCSAEGTPSELFHKIVTVSQVQNHGDPNSDLCVDSKLAFTKDRTISRLTEMNSRKYLEQQAAKLDIWP